MRDVAIGVGVSLEICKILHIGIFSCKELLTFFQLLSDCLLRLAICRIERLVVAISTTTHPNRSVTVGTGEAGIKRNLLYLETKLLLEPRAELVVSLYHYKRTLTLLRFPSTFHVITYTPDGRSETPQRSSALNVRTSEPFAEYMFTTNVSISGVAEPK